MIFSLLCPIFYCCFPRVVLEFEEYVFNEIKIIRNTVVSSFENLPPVYFIKFFMSSVISLVISIMNRIFDLHDQLCLFLKIRFYNIFKW